MINKWQRITDEDPPCFKTFLVQHEDDLYPAIAFRASLAEGWLYQQDGPEDVIELGDHGCTPLKRAPTHYKEIGLSPLVEAEYLRLKTQRGVYNRRRLNKKEEPFEFCDG